jgi:hypothetical protein
VTAKQNFLLVDTAVQFNPKNSFLTSCQEAYTLTLHNANIQPASLSLAFGEK